MAEAGLAAPDFEEYLTLTNELAGLYSITLDTSSMGIDFTSAVLTGTGGTFELMNSYDNGVVELWQFTNLMIGAGEYTLTINGVNRGTGSLAGTVTIAQAVPEPATWAMMLLGFGAVGFGMRRQRRQTLMQLA